MLETTKRLLWQTVTTNTYEMPQNAAFKKESLPEEHSHICHFDMHKIPFQGQCMQQNGRELNGIQRINGNKSNTKLRVI